VRLRKKRSTTSGERTDDFVNGSEVLWKNLGGHPVGCTCPLCVQARRELSDLLPAPDTSAAPIPPYPTFGSMGGGSSLETKAQREWEAKYGPPPGELCEKVETRCEPPPNTGCVPLQGITYYEESAVPAKCDRCNAVYLPSPTTGLQMLNKCPRCFGPLVAVQEQEQRP
jgi:hypothetical protein